MKGFNEYFKALCAHQDLEIENSHPSATCTNRLDLALPPGPSPFQCKESEATGTSLGCHFGNPLSELQVTSLSTLFQLPRRRTLTGVWEYSTIGWLIETLWCQLSLIESLSASLTDPTACAVHQYVFF